MMKPTGSILDGLDDLGGGLRPTQIPDGVGAFELGQKVYRGEVVLTPQQLSMLKEMLQYEAPKLQAIAVGRLQGEDFAAKLERAIRSTEKSRNQPPTPPRMLTDQRPKSQADGNAGSSPGSRSSATSTFAERMSDKWRRR